MPMTFPSLLKTGPPLLPAPVELMLIWMTSPGLANHCHSVLGPFTGTEQSDNSLAYERHRHDIRIFPILPVFDCGTNGDHLFSHGRISKRHHGFADPHCVV